MTYMGLVPHPADKDYGVRVSRFAGREGRLTLVEKWFASDKARVKWLTEQESLPNWHGIDAYYDPKVGITVPEA